MRSPARMKSEFRAVPHHPHLHLYAIRAFSRQAKACTPTVSQTSFLIDLSSFVPNSDTQTDETHKDLNVVGVQASACLEEMFRAVSRIVCEDTRPLTAELRTLLYRLFSRDIFLRTKVYS